MKNAKHFLDLEAWNRFHKEYEEVDDRSCAILCASYLDQCLEILLLKCLANKEGAHEKLFAEQRPLGTFSAKIDIAYSINLIPKSFRDDLNLIRRIRNHFAHGLAGLNFVGEPTCSRCLALETPKAYPTGIDQTFSELCNQDPRELFMFTSYMLSWAFEHYYTERTDAISHKLKSLEPRFD